MAPHRQFTEDERASAIATLTANRGNAKRTARNLGIPRTTLRQWVGRAKSSTAVPAKTSPAVVDAYKGRLARKFEEFADLALDEVPSRIPTMSGRDLLFQAAIATDKVLLLRGQATNRTESLKISLVVPGGLRSAAGNVLEGEFEQLPAKTPDVTW